MERDPIMKTILVIEDERDLLELISFNLEKEGYRVMTAMDGASGLETARNSLPDLILLDLMLPGMTGIEICKILKRNEKTSKTPIIMLTAKGEEIDRVVGFEVGADDYVVKPFSPQEVVSRVRAVLRRARGFGMKLLANDIIPIAPDFIVENGIEMTSLQNLLERSDFVSVNCDLNPTSRHLINKDTLGKMRPTAVLINTARGPIVDEAALIQALQAHTIAGAALDVFEVEPLPKTSPLVEMDNVMLAPHNSNSSPRAWERVHWNTIRNLIDGLGLEYLETHAAGNA